MQNAIERIKKGKGAGCSGLRIDLIKHLGESGVDMMLAILKRVLEEEQMLEEWKKSQIVPIYKQKGNPPECGNFRGIKLLEHGMKITVNNMQFGFLLLLLLLLISQHQCCDDYADFWRLQ